MEKSALEPQSNPQPAVEIYQFHILLLEISPAIWRRILVRKVLNYELGETFHRWYPGLKLQTKTGTAEAKR